MEQLSHTARALVAPGKGILAADESIGTMSKAAGGRWGGGQPRDAPCVP